MGNGKVAFIFPGQGSQYVGMGKEFYDTFSVAREIFNETSEVLGYNLSTVCFEGPLETLSQTLYSQVAILTVSYACHQVLMREKSIGSPTYVAGHSLGEYTALVAAEALDLKTAVFIVKKRAEFMEEASKATPGGMVAILGLNREEVKDICKEIPGVGIANLNCPGQVVVSGLKNSLSKCVELSKRKGAKKVIPLKVSGPFHSIYMEDAGKRLEVILSGIRIANPKVPIIANATARCIKDSLDIKKALVKQISNEVLWEQSIELMIDLGVSEFIEIGPGKVLSGLVKRINREVLVKSVEDIKGLEGL
ncbi:MAG: ACP S-malonyltransferase [bacterium]|nr:ACP S-malonyltransferase [bacterium]